MKTNGDDSRIWSKKLREEQEERLWKQIPFRKLDEEYLKHSKRRDYKGIPYDQRSKNFMVMKLLSHVPEFKNDVAELRKKFGINTDGFESQWDVERWATNKNKIWDHQDNFSKENDGAREVFPANPFEKKMFQLGVKYRLPSNFYVFPHRGLSVFVLTGRIIPPDFNYDIDFHFKDGELLWTKLIAYVPLSKKEFENAMESSRETQLGIIPQFFKNRDLFTRRRYRDNVYRDLIMLSEQVERLNKPKKIKKYKNKSYLSLLKKSNTQSNKEMKQWERQNRADIMVDFDNPTSTQIGKKQGVSGDAARQAKKRLNTLAKELFGYDLEL